ncbi:RGG repeats nuclear RNA binding protein A-like [Tasmannia lanceolata]|uniref:RGG repeats nuclear RNA binding protein A-like n=1 Tax=Tasmannia lanceolata TaxID=3420 RepID=UPI004063D5D6
MASTNPFDLLGEFDNDDPSQLISVPRKTLAPSQSTAQPQPKPAKMPSKPSPPAQAVRDAKNEMSAGRGGGRGGGRGFGRGGGRGGGFNRDSGNIENAYNNGVPGGYVAAKDGDVGKPSERERGSFGGSERERSSYGGSERERSSFGGPRGPFRGGRRDGFSNGEAGDDDRPRRQFERHSGTGRGSEFKREGSGRGNWGTPTDEVLVPENEELTNAKEKNLSPEKLLGEEDAAGGNKENSVNEPEEKEPEDKEMTLEEYEKVLEEKRKALQALKAEERKVDLDKDFESMQQLSAKKGNDDIFIKLGSEKDKRKEIADKEEKAKKSVSINEFLKPAGGGRDYGPRGRGRGRGDRGFRGGFAGGNMMSNAAAPSIEDPGQFPTLGAK